jgi:hypothetical protein
LRSATTVKKILRKEQLGPAGTRGPVAPTTSGAIVSIPHVGDLHHTTNGARRSPRFIPFQQASCSQQHISRNASGLVARRPDVF